ncbi:thiosulfate oxidation carrier protein SoxY [Halorhodospira neutriphila]|uniref:Thiosulfate oxidation carrier protein SoxY n=1 Tax=Halorhodospira neutriphila TaxID=168379 RepID=A0ABS1E2W9_9GAMM|nr:thiosulfate oxidation carrier protein SoxY [Halorhodospira neutriphila]MBK1726046.1 thiosulfate oxidation carrier protein SoxY [Halorhodospira neutriphila]
MENAHTDERRRRILKGAMAASGVGAAVGLGLLAPRRALAAWHEESIMARSVDKGLKAYLGTTEFERSDGVVIDAPQVAENGSTVPVTVESSLPDVRSITLYVEENGAPMTSIYEFGPRGQPYVSQRIRMADTSKVVAVADSGGKLYWNSRKVRVTIGGCGG